MGCLKCGQDTGVSSVFCDDCLAKMTKYPVKPDIAVQLPQRIADTEDKKPVRKKKQLTTAQLLKKSQRRVLWLSAAVIFLIISLVISLSLLAYTLML